MQQEKYISKCCHYDVDNVNEDEGTMFFRCLKCGEACDGIKADEKENKINDLVKMAKDFDNPNLTSLFETAYNRGFYDGYEMIKKSIIEEIKRI